MNPEDFARASAWSTLAVLSAMAAALLALIVFELDPSPDPLELPFA